MPIEIRMKLHIILIFILIGNPLWAGSLKLQVSHPKGSYVLESEALRWKLTGRGRAIQLQEKSCGKEVWESFRQRIDQELTAKFEQIPNDLTKIKTKKKIEVLHFEYNGNSFRVPARGNTAKFLNELPDEFVITQSQENIFCQRAAQK